jgi:hypothetical protein
MKIKCAAVASFIFVFLLCVVNYIHVSFFIVNVVFYSAIADTFIAALLASLILLFFTFFRPLSNFEKTQLLIIWILAGYSFSITIPTVVDRSLSLYILEKIQQRGGGIKKESFANVFTQEYVKEHRLVDVRLTEQLESGTIIIVDDCVKLTERGKLIAKISRIYRQHLLPKNRLLMGEYSDDLTDPFRHSTKISYYVCQ